VVGDELVPAIWAVTVLSIVLSVMAVPASTAPPP
jgi:hypothetical protein